MFPNDTRPFAAAGMARPRLVCGDRMRYNAARRGTGGWMGILDRIMSALTSSKEEPPAARPGRNEPCWCGSGVKYKKCHLPHEEAKAAEKACSIKCGPT